MQPTALRALFEYKDYNLESGYTEDQLDDATNFVVGKKKIHRNYSVLNGERLIPYDVKSTDQGGIQDEKKMSAENIREHKNFDDAKADLVIHPVNV